jgi:hypothetical protein
MKDWDNSVTAIPSWVASKAREIMTLLWLNMPERTALYMDTDSLLVRAQDRDVVPVALAAKLGMTLRVKRSWDRVTIKGPRQIITGNQIRVSGVPGKAERLPDGSLQGHVWESLRGALRNGRTTQVKITPRRWRLQGVDTRRTVGGDGWTEPVILGA